MCVVAASFTVKSPAVVVPGYTHSAAVASGMPPRLQLITSSSTVNAFTEAVAKLAPEDCLDCFLEHVLDYRNKSNSYHQTFSLPSYNFSISD